MRVTKLNTLSNTNIRDTFGVKPLKKIIEKKQLGSWGHMTRMSGKQASYSNMENILLWFSAPYLSYISHTY